MTIAYSGDSITFPDNSVQNTAATGFGFKSRIINGACVIDQRNAGASVTIDGTNSTYAIDRWSGADATDGAFTLQRSTTAPAGYINSLLATITTADASLAATQRSFIVQYIEGLNCADLGWGTASAATVTLSFWVRSSLTGTFGGSLYNSAEDRSYPFTYTISAANTFEQKSVTIAGDTTGTWLTTNGIGIAVGFNLGTGSTYTGTAGAWAATRYYSATGAISVIGTVGATFYITGVQLEKGSTATSFDYRPYGTELALCQRYFQKAPITYGAAISPTKIGTGYVFPVSMRASPTTALLTSNPYAEWPDNVGYTASGATLGGNIPSPAGAEFRVGGFSGMIAGKAPMWLAENVISLSSEL
jgi:hypothetical protein